MRLHKLIALPFSFYRQYNDSGSLDATYDEEDDQVDSDYRTQVSSNNASLGESGVEDEEEYYDEGNDEEEDEEALNDNFIIEG